ncbi:hypothetical protein ABT317_44155, partial [Streptomyces carpinensis]
MSHNRSGPAAGQPVDTAVGSQGRRRAVAGAARVLSPRGALAVHQVDGAFLFALRAALAMALVALPIVLAGRAELAVYAMLGAFTTTFGRNLPYPRRGVRGQEPDGAEGGAEGVGADHRQTWIAQEPH